jgi:Lon protease-like protein
MEIPLFPLHTVLAPGIVLPLHVFEPRYRALVRHCLDTSTPFGVVLIREGREVLARDGTPQELAIAGVGTFAEIREASRYSDGRWDVLAVGAGRFSVAEVRSDVQPYLVADVNPIDDEPGDPEVAEALVERVTRRFVDYLRLLQPRDGEEVEPIDVQVELEVPEGATEEDREAEFEPEEAGREELDGGSVEVAAALRIPEDPSALSFLLTGIVQADPVRKQALLEATTAEARLREIDDLLDREILLLSRRLAPFSPDRTVIAIRSN